MLLKKLTATGFKSFADKTEFEFGSGITGIVGPNGCGKSNVVDAIKWVLGEQSAKSLRGKQMLDVIFNGSGTRKSSGLAQVDLTFDNTDGTLPVDQAEVTVSRRLYRSGESEYLLNKQLCRLKDVRELFLDTGIGIDAYSVIEQGRVDVLLQANPTERRQIFEEAAGISKYKVRKKEAQRRLERVNQNLLRVQDIVEEIEKRLRSVKLAAGKARNYQSYNQRLRELRSRYALAEYHRHRSDADAHSREADGLSDEVTRIRTDLSNNEARSSQANVRILELEQETSQAESRLLTVQSQITGQQERIAAADRRISDQTDLLGSSRERLAGFDGQVAALESRLTEQQRVVSSIEQELQSVQAELSAMQDQDRGLAGTLLETQQRLDDEKAGIIELLRRTSRLNNEIQGLNLQHESLTTQKAKLDERDQAIATQLAEAFDKQQQMNARREQVLDLIEDQTKKLEETRGSLAEVAHHRSALLDQLAAAKEYRSGLESRRQLLAEMDRKHEGLMAGAREILQQRDAARGDEEASAAEREGPFSYVLGAVGEIFDADVSHAGLIEAVLGNYEKYLVVAKRDSILADRDALAELSGPVRAFCLDAVPPPIGGPDMSNQEGFIARLVDWITYPPTCERLARHLLGRTYVVESIEHARRMASLDSVARFVTMDGLVWDSDGRVGLGPMGAGTGMISRRSELRELDKQLEEVGQRIVTLSDDLNRSDSEAGHLEEVVETLHNAIADANTQRVEVGAQLAAVEDVVSRLSQERPLIASEVSILVNRLAEMRERESVSKQDLSQLETRSTESERMVAELQAKIESLAAQRQTIAESITGARVRTGELSQRRSAASTAIAELQAARIQLQTDRDKAEHDVQLAQERIDQSNAQMADAKSALEQLTVEHKELTEKARSLREDRDTLRSEVESLASDARRLRGDQERVEAQLHERQIKLQELRVRLEDLAARVMEELSVDLVTQYADYVPDQEEDWPAVEAEIEELRQKIDRLGNVNLDSITEQTELEQRLEFLTTQCNDLKTSETQLLELIEKLNVESRQRFIDTFNAVVPHFQSLFKRLFGGGKAELILMDPNDVLECGIEINAKPPGKEPKGISQLSGGERTMTTIALVLAVFRSRPSPFVLLDEVDAALDEANNVRFNNIIREFTELSQFIVITHSKRTMGIADVLYGVTMQEAGVSKRVSVRFDEGESAVA
ncbi:MAG: chromosome segregation protein SMC [Planctomycetia bacterium]|nr:chromosome segregation protein SMC [Planctomycetia bacterium]MCC7313782.1 chromosome segregation protein SMC [Planctomycetota bacterium]